MKPTDYTARRTWQNEARARGEIPECGREACNRRWAAGGSRG